MPEEKELLKRSVERMRLIQQSISEMAEKVRKEEEEARERERREELIRQG